MNWFERIKTTLRADAHGLVDALEDEGLLLKQHVRDAELEVQRKRARLSQLETEHKRLGAELARLEEERARLERDVDLALESERDDLARYTLKQLLERRGRAERVQARLAQIADESKPLAQLLFEQQIALEELRARVQSHLAEREAGAVESRAAPVTEEQIDLELLRRKGERTRAEPAPRPEVQRG